MVNSCSGALDCTCLIQKVTVPSVIVGTVGKASFVFSFPGSLCVYGSEYPGGTVRK